MPANCSPALRSLAVLFLTIYALPVTLGAQSLAQSKPAAQQTAMPADLKAAFENARYGIQRDAKGGQRAQNDANHFAVQFAGAKTIIEAGKGADATLSVAGYGWGSALRSAGAVTHEETTGKRLERQYGSGLSEWFENTPRGLEQGFVLRQRDEGARGALRIRLASAGGWGVSTAGDGVRFTKGPATLRYAGLRAWDAKGVAVASHLRAVGSKIEIEVEDERAVYPLTVDPTFTLQYSQQQELTASDSGGLFGDSVALSSDGNTAVVGALSGDGNLGAVYVFTRSGAVWSQQQELTGGGNGLGAAVAISGDGNTALVGATDYATEYTPAVGDAYVFTRSGAIWSQQQELTPSDAAANDFFGASLALSGDGNTALVGATNFDPGSNYNSGPGAAYVFTRSGATWSQQQKLMASDAANNDNFGSSTGLSGDGNTALVGANRKNSQTGAAYVFTRSGATWKQQQELTASPSGYYFGYSGALTNDGSTALVGALEGNSGAGSAYVFTRSGSIWSQQQELTASDAAADDQFASSVALSSAGNTALVGANEKNSFRGAAYVFSLPSSFSFVPLGQSEPQTLTFTVPAAATLGTPLVLTGGAPNLDFTLASGSTCTGAVSAGATCAVNVTFTPPYAGLRSGAVEILDNSGNVLATTYLQGTGVGPEVGFSPATVSTIGTGLQVPQAIALDGAGNTYIADKSLGAIKVSASSGTQTMVGSGIGDAAGVAVDGAGNLFIVDEANGLVAQVPAGGGAQTTVVSSLSSPSVRQLTEWATSTWPIRAITAC